MVFFDAPFGRGLSRGGGITSMVSGIIGTGEVLLVASTAGLRAVTLVNCKLSVREKKLKGQAQVEMMAVWSDSGAVGHQSRAIEA